MGSVAAFVFLLVGLLFPAALAFTLTLRCIRRLGRRLLLGGGGPLRLLVLLCGCRLAVVEVCFALRLPAVKEASARVFARSSAAERCLAEEARFEPG